MGHVPWNSPAILVPPGNHPNYAGTLAKCLRHWRDEMNASDQLAAMIAVGNGEWLAPEELMRLSVTIPE
jgi:hypothetical protein